jgi:TRAP-type C4-dicarboxylate transport system permease small subunit
VKFERLINSGIPILCGILLTTIVALTILQVVLRNCFSSAMNWSDEVSQFCMSWLVLFGSIWATKNCQHLNTGLKLHQKMNKKKIHLIDAILDLFLIVVGVVVAYQTGLFTLTVLHVESLSLTWLKMGYIFIAMPLAMLGLCYYSLKGFLENLKGIIKKD